jgi:hypothetical protein
MDLPDCGDLAGRPAKRRAWFEHFRTEFIESFDQSGNQSADNDDINARDAALRGGAEFQPCATDHRAAADCDSESSGNGGVGYSNRASASGCHACKSSTGDACADDGIATGEHYPAGFAAEDDDTSNYSAAAATAVGLR